MASAGDAATAASSAAPSAAAGVNHQNIMFACASVSLEPEVTRRVATYVASPPPSDRFDGLCAALRSAFDKSIAEMWAKFMDMTLGDGLPSESYFTIVGLWPDPALEQSPLLWHRFTSKLPSRVALLLSEAPTTAADRANRLYSRRTFTPSAPRPQ
jgi:hypothetical protein